MFQSGQLAEKLTHPKFLSASLQLALGIVWANKNVFSF